MKNFIYCKTVTKGTHAFYLKNCGYDYFLFVQDYRKGVHEYYRNGVTLEIATDYSKSKNDSAIMRTMSKLFSYVKYVEKENGIEVLEQTIKKNARRKKCA